MTCPNLSIQKNDSVRLPKRSESPDSIWGLVLARADWRRQARPMSERQARIAREEDDGGLSEEGKRGSQAIFPTSVRYTGETISISKQAFAWT